MSNQVSLWKAEFEDAMQLNEVLAELKEDLLVPDKTTDQLAIFSPIHSAFQAAVLEEFRFRMSETRSLAAHQGEATIVEENVPDASEPVIVICNRYSAASPGLRAGPLTRGTLLDCVTFDGKVMLMQISGSFLAAMVRRNAFYAGCADFLYMSGVTYDFRCRDGTDLPTKTLSREELQAGRIECSNMKVAGVDLNEKDGTYWCLMDEYLFGTILENVPGREGCKTGPAIHGYRDLLIGHFKRGKPLRSGC